MLLKHRSTGDMVEISDISELVNPAHQEVSGRSQAGQEEQNPESFAKAELIFLSGEALPRCWRDVDYRTSGN